MKIPLRFGVMCDVAATNFCCACAHRVLLRRAFQLAIRTSENRQVVSKYRRAFSSAPTTQGHRSCPTRPFGFRLPARISDLSACPQPHRRRAHARRHWLGRWLPFRVFFNRPVGKRPVLRLKGGVTFYQPLVCSPAGMAGVFLFCSHAFTGEDLRARAPTVNIWRSL